MGTDPRAHPRCVRVLHGNRTMPIPYTQNINDNLILKIVYTNINRITHILTYARSR